MSAEISLRKLASTLEVDPLFSKSPDDAREDTINDSFGWGSTNRIIGQNIWNRAREYERHNSADQSRVIAVLTEGLAVIRSSDELEEIGTPCCNCGRLADHIADAIDKILAEAKRIQEGK